MIWVVGVLDKPCVVTASGVYGPVPATGVLSMARLCAADAASASRRSRR